MDKSSQYWVVIPATGIGQRMKAACPKQYIKLSKKTILEHTLDNLLSYPRVTGAIVILNSSDQYWKKLNYKHEKPVLLCTGGEQRHHSVYNGLLRLKQHTEGNPYVLIHDAVRPFVSHDDLNLLLDTLDESDDGALLAVPVADTLKLANDNQAVKITYPRDNLWRAFTPQAFRLNKISSALENVIKNDLEITDDSSAMELMGARPKLVPGDVQNIKITTPQDLILAKKLIKVNN
ncbi:MAG: 2-C-methyl-D-erythritol 4-phosphate cytidylyltransferase [Gammaproteobacteria bacterium]|jgi:2-C-methyl-D-erythritol 4-phosphate cytidylyltransferase|nr:2-C-methyl-D-erythritol 4-phosphate cytidylyltransferase [Gammaproteobacteria bacterium]MBT4451307.1 2-C-methyl-D-erythritol 4-phosphate cytidylyltransferase [Gammaproteobacteria bacterium]MBT7044279.1 2-C-methyl-D-erythritol 4-phosphate cytidylyltransferase [Gammaproteobacteria bacterium]